MPLTSLIRARNNINQGWPYFFCLRSTKNILYLWGSTSIDNFCYYWITIIIKKHIGHVALKINFNMIDFKIVRDRLLGRPWYKPVRQTVIRRTRTHNMTATQVRKLDERDHKPTVISGLCNASVIRTRRTNIYAEERLWTEKKDGIRNTQNRWQKKKRMCTTKKNNDHFTIVLELF